MGSAISSRLSASSSSSSSPCPSSSSSRNEITPQVVAVAELEGFADVVTRCVKSCYVRCLHLHADSSLDISEMSCTDRCVEKY
ncbi:mitochondrial import inner membrane translocase subunit tim10, partial [Cystoisospora suis]